MIDLSKFDGKGLILLDDLKFDISSLMAKLKLGDGFNFDIDLPSPPTVTIFNETK